MRRLLLVLLVGTAFGQYIPTVPATAASAGGSVTYVSSSYAVTNGGTCGNSCTQALGANAVSGGIVIFAVKWQNTATTISSVSGTNGTCSLLSATTWTDSTDNYAGESGYCLPTSSAAYTVTFNMSAGTFQFGSQIAAYTGQNATPIDVSNGASVNCAGTSCSAPSVTTTATNDLVVSTAWETSGNGISFTAGSGTLRGSSSGAAALQDQTQASAGAVAPNFTTTSAASFTGLSTIAIKHA